MGRLIDADWLKAQWEEPTDWMDGDQVLHHYTWFKIMLELAPTVDAVPVVRCKDCKFFSHGYCRFHDAKFVRPDGYCYWGERKDGNHHD